jgi:pimeloyl-ACP methyl ester carboxylesterase
VLVHGAWADASSWTPVIAGLQDDGYTVVAPPNTLRGIKSDSDYLAAYLATIKGPIVLVGHSYGGAVITNAATGNAQIKALVYVDAFIPKKGETVLQLVSERPGSCLSGGGDPTKVFTFVSYPGAPPDDFDLYIKTQPDDPYPGFAACFANDLPTAEAAILAATQRPFTLSGGNEPSGRPAWKQIPSWAVVGTDDQVVPPAELLFMARRAGAQITKIDAGHLSMLSHPDDVVDVIESAAGSR